jgi:hypothetical protein
MVMGYVVNPIFYHPQSCNRSLGDGGFCRFHNLGTLACQAKPVMETKPT